MSQTHQRSCHLCEAMCGVVLETEGDRVVSVRGDADDPMSRGYICPKAVGLVDVQHDPDRLRTPLRRRGDGFEPIGWDEAFDLVGDRLRAIRRDHGADAIAVYQGNPTAHNLGLMTFGQLLFRRLGTKNLYSATSSDQLPHMLSSLLMFGHQVLLPVPDIDRTDFMLLLGANPAISNGSLMSAPDMKRRLADIRRRGGTVVVVDPRRSETAELSDRHLFVRPGSDALFLLSLLHTIYGEGLADPGRLAGHADGDAALRALVAEFAPEATAGATGVAASELRRLARDFANAPRAVAYGRIGTCTQEFGGLCSWLVNLVNYATGNLDEPGGAMFATPAIDVVTLMSRAGHRGSFRAFTSRVRGLPEFGGELPGSVLAEEIETPGPGQIRALISSAGNPVLSLPNGGRLERALGGLDFMVAIDFYLNETTRHADVILPPTWALERDHYDIGLNVVAVRNLARYAAPVFARGPDQRHDWEICLELSRRLETDKLGRVAARALTALGRRLGPRGLLRLGFAFGPYRRRGLSLGALEQAPHGLDFGPLEPRLPGVLGSANRRIQLVPAPYLDDVARLRTAWAGWARRDGLTLIGRRQLRSNNSWLHNSERLVKGKVRCTLLVHPVDATRLGLVDHGEARITSRAGAVIAPVEISDEIMPGVVSLPHGWGHARAGTRLAVANRHAGVSVNDLTDERFFDQLSGTAGFTGVTVEVAAVAAALPRAAAES